MPQRHDIGHRKRRQRQLQQERHLPNTDKLAAALVAAGRATPRILETLAGKAKNGHHS